MLKIGQKIKITAEKIITGGDGMGHSGNFVVMVPYAVPADVLSVEITEAKRNFARGKIVSVLKPSPGRITPQCPYHFSPGRRFYCGGCNLQMLDYPGQLEAKAAIAGEFFRGIKPEIAAAENCFGYRNKIQMPVGGAAGKAVIGFFHPRSHDIINIENCLLQSETANAVMAELRGIINEHKIQPYDEDRGTGTLRHILLRQSMAFNSFMIIFVSKTDISRQLNGITGKIVKKFPQISSVHQNINSRKTNVILGERTSKIYGANAIREKIGGLVFEISPGSFFQVNTAQAEKLYDMIKKYAGLGGGEHVVDIYCGSGGISLYLAKHCGRVTGIEEVKSAVYDAKKNAALNGINNAFFIRGSADYAMREAEISKNSIIVLDPPRIGCSALVLNSLIQHRPQKIIYTSCNPATLARDISILSAAYKLEKLAIVDMFPNTAHIECVAKLIRC